MPISIEGRKNRFEDLMGEPHLGHPGRWLVVYPGLQMDLWITKDSLNDAQEIIDDYGGRIHDLDKDAA